MRLAMGRYEHDEELVVITDLGVFRVNFLAQKQGLKLSLSTMDALLSMGSEGLDLIRTMVQWALRTGVTPDQEPQMWLPPVRHPDKIICVGLNYRSHAAESGLELPSHPVLFNKFGNALVGANAVVDASDVTHQLDYEAELVMVIGRRCSRVAEENALHYVMGYCNGNDLSARDLQFRTSQWLLGKAVDGFAPIGPYLVTPEDVPAPSHLEIIGRRNGVEVQHSNTEHMIFSPAYLIHYISQYITLEPGDVIFTGTPDGVILGYPEDQRHWLQPGETVSVAIEGLGELVTHIGSPQNNRMA